VKKLIKKWHSKDLSIQRKQQTSVENLKTISGLQSVVPKEVPRNEALNATYPQKDLAMFQDQIKHQ
jgi:hypothetical protein